MAFGGRNFWCKLWNNGHWKKTNDVLHILARQQTLKWQRKLVYCSGIKTVLLLALNEYNCQYIPAHMSSMSRHTVNGITLNSKFQHKQLCSGHNTDTAWIDTDEILSRTIFCQFCSNVVCLAVNVLTQHETCKFPVGTQRCRHERKCTKCGRYLHLWPVYVNLCNRLKFPFPSLDIYCLLGRACLCRSWECYQDQVIQDQCKIYTAYVKTKI